MRTSFRLLILFLLTLSTAALAQKSEWQSIMMLDTIQGYNFSIDQVNNAQYGPENLFDSKLESCWVAGKSSLYLLVPQYDRVLNIFNGYGKSPNLYQQNSRVKKMVIHFYLGVQPEGYVSEIGAEYYLYDPHIKQEVVFEDIMKVRHIALLDTLFNNQMILDEAFSTFNQDVGFEINEVQPIIKLEIVDVFEGAKYDDICISELYFSDKYLPYISGNNAADFDSLFINRDENALLGRLVDGQTQELYANKDEVIWLAEVSTDNTWVILMTMPGESEGHGLSQFLLVNTKSKTIVNKDLEQSLGRQISQMFFNYKNTVLYLNYITTDDEEYLVQLK